MNRTDQTQFHGRSSRHDDRLPLGFGRGCAKCDAFWATERDAYENTAALLRALSPDCDR